MSLNLEQPGYDLAAPSHSLAHASWAAFHLSECLWLSLRGDGGRATFHRGAATHFARQCFDEAPSWYRDRYPRGSAGMVELYLSGAIGAEPENVAESPPHDWERMSGRAIRSTP